jgi:hypothetical protein
MTSDVCTRHLQQPAHREQTPYVPCLTRSAATGVSSARQCLLYGYRAVALWRSLRALSAGAEVVGHTLWTVQFNSRLSGGTVCA